METRGAFRKNKGYFPAPTSHCGWGRRIYEGWGNIFSYYPPDMRSAFGRKISKLFWKNFFSHYPLEFKSRFGRKLWKFPVPTFQWKRECQIYEGWENFLPSTPLWRWEMRFDELPWNFSSSLTTADESDVFSMKFIFLYEIFAALTYLGKMSTPQQKHRRKTTRGMNMTRCIKVKCKKFSYGKFQ